MATRLAVASLLLTASLAAQAPLPAFEVVSIKTLAAPPQGFNPGRTSDGVFSLPAATAAYLVTFAYKIRSIDLVGGPDWMHKDLFEVQAKAAGAASREDMRPMVQSLLRDRFRLTVHEEQRERAYFTMILSRRDGSPGPALLRRDCADRETRPHRPESPAGAAMSAGCGTMAVMSDMLASRFDAPVIDRTGLEGTFDYFMFYSGADFKMPLEVRLTGRAPMPAAREVQDNLPLFREALQDQLGLRLEPARGPLTVLVIDSIQRPTEN